MLTIVIYATDKSYLDKTIDSIVDHTPDSTIIVCDDVGLEWVRDGVVVQRTEKIGRARAWNLAAATVSGGVLVFMKDKVKLSDDWFAAIYSILAGDPRCLISPVIHVLDLSLWMAESGRWKRFGWRWDLRLYDRAGSVQSSPSISSSCFACSKEWFDELGGFDVGMLGGAGEDVELSLRSWLLGGSVAVCDDSVIAAAFEVDYSSHTLSNLARIVEAWLPGYASLFYDLNDVKASMVDTGRLNNLLLFAKRQVKSIDWFLATHQPELLGVYKLKDSAVGKKIAIVAPGPSLDLISVADINRYDIIIGVEYAATIIDCDYVIADTIHVVGELRKKYANDKFLVPTVLQDRTSASIVLSDAFIEGAIQFELQNNNAAVGSTNPPFCNADNLAITAIHLALFMRPDSITVFGHDGKLIGGKSHTAKVEYYNGGKLWSDTEAVRRQFAAWEHWLDQLGKLASVVGVPLMRVSHA